MIFFSERFPIKIFDHLYKFNFMQLQRYYKKVEYRRMK